MAKNHEEHELLTELKMAKKKIKDDLSNFIARCQESSYIINAIKSNDQIRNKCSRLIQSRWRAKLKKASIGLTEEERNQIKRFYDECPENHDVDHIIPLSKGGKHCPDNLQYLDCRANRSKGNKIMAEVIGRFCEGEIMTACFLQRKFRLDYEAAENIMSELAKI